MSVSNWLRRVAPYDWLVLLALAPVFLYADRFPSPLVAAALLCLPLLWFVRFRATGHFIMRTPLDLPILCLLLTVPLSLYASADFAVSLPRLTGLLLGVALYYVFLRFAADARTLPAAVSFWLLSALGVTLLGLFGADWVTIKIPALNRLTSLLPRLVSGLGTRADRGLHPNIIGGTLALFVAPLLSALWSRRAREGATAGWRELRAWLYPDQRRSKIVWLVALLLLGGLLVLTQSRSALFGVAVSLVALAALRYRFVRWLTLLALGGALAATLVVGPRAMGETLFGNGGATAVGSLDFAGRQEVWSRALYAIQDFPFTGVGLGQFEELLKILYPLFISGPDAEVPHAHNLYLQAAVDFGVGGLVAYVALLMGALALAVRAARALADSLARRLLLGFACGLLAYQVFGLSDAVALGTKPSIAWWLSLAMIAGLYLQAKPALGELRWRVASWEVIALWLLTSLIAIAHVGENALLGVGLAILGGVALGLAALLEL